MIKQLHGDAEFYSVWIQVCLQDEKQMLVLLKEFRSDTAEVSISVLLCSSVHPVCVLISEGRNMSVIAMVHRSIQQQTKQNHHENRAEQTPLSCLERAQLK